MSQQLPDSKVYEHAMAEVFLTPEDENQAYGSISVRTQVSHSISTVVRMSRTVATQLRDQLNTILNERHATDDLALMPRIRQALNATTLRRSIAEELFGEPCHRKNCSRDHGRIEELFDHIIDRAIDSVYSELLCRATSEPDLGDTK